MIAEFAKQNKICLDRNMAMVAAGCAGLAMFMFDRKVRRKSAMMAAVSAFGTATATFATLNCATQKAVSDAATDVKEEVKAVAADAKDKATEVKEAVIAPVNGHATANR